MSAGSCTTDQKLCLLGCLGYLAFTIPCALAQHIVDSSKAFYSLLPSQAAPVDAVESEKQAFGFESFESTPTHSFSNDEVKYIGNSVSGKFHRPWCPFEQVMNAHKAVFFHFRRDAIQAGFVPCRYCLPPFVKRVKCVLLKDGFEAQCK